MKFPNKYKCLKNQSFEKGKYKIVPVRYKDRFDIMKWRNDQTFHLRQTTYYFTLNFIRTINVQICRR